jgi:hypothetical protein
MTWRGDGGSEGLRTIVPPIVDSACVFRDGVASRSANTRQPEVQSLIWYVENCAKLIIGTDALRYVYHLRSILRYR